MKEMKCCSNIDNKWECSKIIYPFDMWVTSTTSLLFLGYVRVQSDVVEATKHIALSYTNTAAFKCQKTTIRF